MTTILYIGTKHLDNSSRKGDYHYFKIDGKSRYYKATKSTPAEIEAIHQLDTVQKTQGSERRKAINKAMRTLLKSKKPKAIPIQPKSKKQPQKKPTRKSTQKKRPVPRTKKQKQKQTQTQKKKKKTKLSRGIFSKNYSMKDLLYNPKIITKDIGSFYKNPNLTSEQLTQIRENISYHITFYGVNTTNGMNEMQDLMKIYEQHMTPDEFVQKYGWDFGQELENTEDGYVKNKFSFLTQHTESRKVFAHTGRITNITVQIEVKL